jgi:hypothetical protein
MNTFVKSFTQILIDLSDSDVNCASITSINIGKDRWFIYAPYSTELACALTNMVGEKQSYTTAKTETIEISFYNDDFLFTLEML